MPLKTDYKNFIPSTTTKIHDIKQASDETVLYEDVILEDVTIYLQEGDSFGAGDINATNAQVNANTQSISDIGTILGDVTVEQLALLADVTGDIAEKTIITTDTTDTTPEVTLADNNEYIYSDDAITALDITLASGYTAGFIASVVFVSPASAPTVTLTNTGSYTIATKGDGTWASLVLTPTASKTVTMIFNYDGINMNIYVSEV